MRLHFLKRDVQTLLEHSKKSERYASTYEGERTKRPQLVIVGDEGIYLMSTNGKPSLLEDGVLGEPTPDNPAFVVFAKECNPKTLPFEEWRRIKEQSFGSDGVYFLGADFIEAALLKPGEYIQLEVTEEEIDALY
ncbi:hypothetical protein DSM106972_096720 [Dulcicalothrix desertica PCC 7102]|uniref:DUF3085 domain-containing protein n=1 Tax=Dulcicalothrix desertica PCC 7102 TaxID=232991 RepID=A0A3S5K2R9_9CYAN|nr:DUF3085 domain-containing protein [Dulcicalothrix desertica]RUS93316.1 hypothetical protein DSM106972_096720 [Dulcicalothrix desertica PCC 7102]TWH62775.1 Protein of unknown function (DUF3085) [Dulcicalothrix desertica PCC 7102]